MIINAAGNFFSPDSYTSTLHSGRLSNDYHSFSRRVYSASSPLIFTGGGVKKCEIWPQASTPLFFELPSFRNEATDCYQSILFGAAMMELCSPQIWCSLVHPPSEQQSLEVHPIEKLVTLSITQLGIVQFHSVLYRV